MDVAAPFTWTGTEVALELPGGHVRFTTRRSPPLEQITGIPVERQALSRQVHGTTVRRVTREDELRDAGACDGQATSLSGVACAVRVADCLPVALVADGAVAALHAGWRGLQEGILEAGVEAVRDLAAGGEIRAALGPAAGACCYEVGDEVHAAFAHVGPQARSGANADLKAVARATLAACGVAEVHDAGICTICGDADALWSFRRQGAAAGRQLGVAWRS